MVPPLSAELFLLLGLWVLGWSAVARTPFKITLAKDPTIFVYIATAVVVLIVLAGGRDHADGIRN